MFRQEREKSWKSVNTYNKVTQITEKKNIREQYKHLKRRPRCNGKTNTSLLIKRENKQRTFTNKKGKHKKGTRDIKTH